MPVRPASSSIGTASRTCTWRGLVDGFLGYISVLSPSLSSCFVLSVGYNACVHLYTDAVAMRQSSNTEYMLRSSPIGDPRHASVHRIGILNNSVVPSAFGLLFSPCALMRFCYLLHSATCGCSIDSLVWVIVHWLFFSAPWYHDTAYEPCLTL